MQLRVTVDKIILRFFISPMEPTILIASSLIEAGVPYTRRRELMIIVGLPSNLTSKTSAVGLSDACLASLRDALFLIFYNALYAGRR